jgi:predicted RNA-binding protein with PIN domain
MATAVSLKSESSDHYIFAMDTSAKLTIEGFCEELCKEWWAGEQLEVVEVTSDQFEERELSRKINDALEKTEEC